MPALGAGMHVFRASSEDVDCRVKPGNDGAEDNATAAASALVLRSDPG
jgi:hypothetical protein